MKISIVPSAGKHSITSINTGTSTPRLSGSIDISNFPSLSSFICRANDITSFTGNISTPSLKVLRLSGNKLTQTLNFSNNLSLSTVELNDNLFASSFPTISNLTLLEDFRIHNNLITGVLPPLSTNTNLRNFYCFGASSTSRQISGNLNIQGLNRLTDIRAGNSFLTGTLPNLSSNSSLQQFQVGNSFFSGPLPNLSCFPLVGYQIYNNPINATMFSSLSNIPNIDLFWASSCGLSGSIPPLNSLSKLTRFLVTTNNLTGSVPSLSGCTSLWSFQANVNKLRDFTFSQIPTAMASRVVAAGDTTPKGLVFTSNNFTLTATWYCLSSMHNMYQRATATGVALNTLTGVQIALGGSTMPSISGIGPINTSIKTLIGALSSSPFPGWTITLGTSTING